ncbi:hypothetical protein [Agrococcus sp. SGAir0287]|uniref:hypothetical protein n=1 Tax=Agrococcus sp. SGAir0287 TaxID=2070347 RepID=UPI0010CD4A14|nr:hypothetical protein [Agrococcus sp. SGAir0287]QCR18693.1 hypothetical protein C1N71_03860 [Agrococcus sp. SGAir0287]
MPRIAPAPIGPATAILAGAAALTQGALAVVVLWIFVGVFVIVGVEELLGVLPGDVDVAARTSIVGLFVVAGVGGVGEAVRVALERALRMRTALRLAAEGAPMPPAAERRELVRGAVGTARILCVVLASIAALVALVAGGAGIASRDGVLVGVGAIALVVGGAHVVAAVALRAADAAWQDALGRLRAAWPRFDAADEATGPRLARERALRPRHERRRSRHPGARGVFDRLASVVAVGLPVAFGIVVLGVFLRKQCRTCEPVTYDPWGERAVDGVAAVGLVAFVTMLSLAGLLGVVWLVGETVREAAAARRAATDALPPAEWLDHAIAWPRALELVGRVVGTVAAALAMLVVAAELGPGIANPSPERLAIVEGWRGLGPWALAAAVGALALGVLGAVQAQRWRAVVLPSMRHDPLVGRMRG